MNFNSKDLKIKLDETLNVDESGNPAHKSLLSVNGVSNLEYIVN